MGRTLTNNFSLQYSIEETLGELYTSPSWRQLEPNSIGAFGANISTTPRNPISKNRQVQKGAVTDLDSGVEFESDVTVEMFVDFIEGFLFASATDIAVFVPTAVDADSYTVGAGGALAVRTLVYARGFTNSENNGLKQVAAGAAATDIPVEETLVAEASPPTNVILEVAGYRGAEGDLEINASGNLISTSLDFTSLGLTAGQVIHVGGSATANQFAVAANYGFARIVSIAEHEVVLDKKATTFATDNGSGKFVDLLYGRFLRNVSVDDDDFLEQSYQFEGAWPNLGAAGATEYEYAKGNYCGQLTVNLPLADKATLNFGFVGTDTDVPTTSQATNADEPILPVRQTAFGTASDILRLRITDVDEEGITTDFKSVSLTLNNNVGGEKTLGTLGSTYMNIGNFQVTLEMVALFTSSDVIAAIRNNTTVTMDFSIRNEDGAIFFDIPSMTLSDGSKDLAENESVKVNLTGTAFEDETLGTSIGISLFPYVPAAAQRWVILLAQ